MDPYANDWTRDGLRKLMGAIYPEAVRQAQAERDRAAQMKEALARDARAKEALEAYLDARNREYVFGPGEVHDLLRVPGVRVEIPLHLTAPLPASWRARTPAEVAEYDRRFLHVLGIEPL